MSEPQAFLRHPVMAVLKPGETFKEIADAVQFCEIAWPQCYEFGEPIHAVLVNGRIEQRKV